MTPFFRNDYNKILRLFTLPKKQYIEALVLAGIEKKDILLDPHPPFKSPK